MDAVEGHAAQVGPVGLVLLGHEEEQDPLEELDAVQGSHAHLQEDAVQDCGKHFIHKYVGRGKTRRILYLSVSCLALG